MISESRIHVAGHTGLVGSAIIRRLERDGFRKLLVRTRAELDLQDAAGVRAFYREHQPEYVFIAAAKVGGIQANSTWPVQFLRDNLAIALNLLDAAHLTGVTKLLYLGSSCIYPRQAPQPMKEEHLLTGLLEPTNEPYAIAKIAGIKLCQAYRRQYGAHFIGAMPTNLYGPHDNFDFNTSHVVPALLRRFHEAKVAGAPEVTVWGTGAPRREFLHVDDLADACVFLMQHYDGAEAINVGVGEDITIRDLAHCIAAIVGFTGDIVFDSSKPDGTPRKLLDVSRLHALGWHARISLEEGLRATYAWYREHSDA